LQEKGRQLFGEHFRIYKEDIPVLVPIIAWMLRDTDVAAQYGMDLKKGIFLSGPVGVGKTQIMQLMRYLTTPAEDYNVLSCTKVALDFGRTGPNIIHHYTYGSFNSSDNKPLAYCFDDLGKEILVKHYGTSCQVMQQIILARYELFIQHGMVTHAISSMHTLEIEERYGTEIRSRLREMFNKIGFDNNANDKRNSN
jgi:hypothetical protein